MNPRTMRRFEQLEQMRERLEEELTQRPEALLRQPPPSGGWSILQVVSHLVEAETGTLGYMRKKSAPATQLPRAGVSCEIRSLLLTAALRSPFRFRVPKPIAQNPELHSRDESLEQWHRVRSEWRFFLGEFPQPLENRQIFRHPVAGRMNLDQTLRFLRDHLEHHLRQVERIWRQVGSR